MGLPVVYNNGSRGAIREQFSSPTGNRLPMVVGSPRTNITLPPLIPSNPSKNSSNVIQGELVERRISSSSSSNIKSNPSELSLLLSNSIDKLSEQIRGLSDGLFRFIENPKDSIKSTFNDSTEIVRESFKETSNTILSSVQTMNTSLLETVKSLISDKTKEVPLPSSTPLSSGLGKGSGGVVPPTSSGGDKPNTGSKFSSIFDLKNLAFIASITGAIGSILKFLGRFGLVAALFGFISLLKDPRMLDFSKSLDEFSSKFGGFWDNTLKPILSKLWDLTKDGIFGTLSWFVDTLGQFSDEWKSPTRTQAVLNLIGNIGKGLWNLLDGAISGISEVIDIAFGTNLKQGYSDFKEYIAETFSGIYLKAESIISDVKTSVLGFWEGVVNVFKGLVEFVKNPMDFVKAVYKGTTVEEVRRVDTVEKEAKVKSSELQTQLDKAVEEKKLKQTPKEGGFFSNISSTFTKIAGGDKDLKTFIEENNGNQKIAIMNYRSYLTNVKKLSSKFADQKITEEMNLLNINTNQSNVSRVIQQNPSTPIQKVANLASASKVYTVEKEAQSSNDKSTPSVIAPVTSQSSTSTVNNNIALGGLSSARNTSQNASLLASSNKFN